MPDVPKHAWTHRPRAQGGTDPIAFEVAAGGGIVSPYPRAPLHVGSASGEYNTYPGGVVVVSAPIFMVNGSSTTDSSGNYSGQTFLRYTTSAPSYAAANDVMSIDPAAIGLMDDHAYSIVYQYRLSADATANVFVGWEHAGAVPAVVADTLPTGTAGGLDWFSLGLMSTTVGVAKVQHGTDILIRAYSSAAHQIDFDQVIFIPNDYQADSPPTSGDPGVFDTYVRVPDLGQLSSTTSIEFPDTTHFNGQCISDTQTVFSLLDPTFRWSTTAWASYQQPRHGSTETSGIAWDAPHGRHLYATARLQGEAGSTEDSFFSPAAVSYGSNGMPLASAILWNNSWQIVYLGPGAPNYEIAHLAGWVIAADPGGNEAPFNDDGETTIADVRMGSSFFVTSLYDPQGS